MKNYTLEPINKNTMFVIYGEENIGKIVYDEYEETWRQSGDEYCKEYAFEEDAAEALIDESV